jgi:Rod binding domain-containing protein
VNLSAVGRHTQTAAAAPKDAAAESALRRSCQQFESFFVKELISIEAEAGDGGSLGRPDEASGTVRAMTQNAMADAVSDAGGIGLWKPLYTELHKLLPGPQAKGTLRKTGLVRGRME